MKSYTLKDANGGHIVHVEPTREMEKAFDTLVMGTRGETDTKGHKQMASDRYTWVVSLFMRSVRQQNLKRRLGSIPRLHAATTPKKKHMSGKGRVNLTKCVITVRWLFAGYAGWCVLCFLKHDYSRRFSFQGNCVLRRWESKTLK